MPRPLASSAGGVAAQVAGLVNTPDINQLPQAVRAVALELRRSRRAAGPPSRALRLVLRIGMSAERLAVDLLQHLAEVRVDGFV
jgi:hypothetical protein